MLAGNAQVYLPLVHFLLLQYSPVVALFIKEQGFEFTAQNDYAFMQSAFEVLIKLFDYTPKFKLDDFFVVDTAVNRKIDFMLSLITMVK